VNRSYAYLVHLALTCLALGLTWAARDATRARRLWPLMGAVLGASVISFAVWDWGRATPFGDFNKAYYPAGRIVFSDPERLYDCNPGNLCFVNIPIVAALFTPVAALPPVAARAVFTGVGITGVIAATWLLVGITGASGWRRYAIVAVVFLNGPLLYSVRLGNLSHVLLVPLLVALTRLAANRQASAGATLALVALIKPPLFLFLPYLLFRRHWRAAAAMSATTAVVCALSILWLGGELHRTWLRDYVIEFGARPIAAYNVQSISGALARFAAPNHSTDWRPLDVTPLFTVVRYLLTLACVAWAFVVSAAHGRPRTPAARWTEYSVLLCLMLLASPITWTHYYCALVIPLALYLGRGLVVPLRSGWAAAIFVAGLLISLPVVLPRPGHPLLAALHTRVLISHYVFGAASLLGTLLLALGTGKVLPSQPSTPPAMEVEAGPYSRIGR
jgi:hypothetical protein